MEKQIEQVEDDQIVEEDLTKLDDATDWRAKAQEIEQRRREDGIRARERTKSLKEKLKVFEQKPPEDKIEQKPDNKLFERFDKMALSIAGIKEADEIELFNKWKDETKREADDILGNEIFNKELGTLRVAKANQQATSDIRGERSGTGGAKNTADYWVAKATKGKDGKLEFPEDTPKELYSKILDKISEQEPASSETLKFYNK